MRDPYDILGVPRSASEGEIRDAFRRLAREHHPDRNPNDAGAQQRFQELNTAFQILSDPARRARYDQLGDTSRTGGGPPRGAAAYTTLEDLFADLFGGFVAPHADQGDLQHVVALTFEEAALGCSKSLRYERIDHCQTCHGAGAPTKSQLRPCHSCGGSGRVQLGNIGLFGLAGARPCPTCAGRGRIPTSPCETCRGSGLTARGREIEIQVPKGIENGASQVVASAGNRPSPGQPPGDLELIIRVEPHPRFTREGDDVHSELEVSFTRCALGATVQVQTLHGEEALTIPAGTQHDSVLRLKGRGVPHRFRGGNGDHHVRVLLRVRPLRSRRARELAREFDEASQEDEGLLDRFKAWLDG